ncbi:hypothetical protein [Beduini massiliensis]|uniref:hypothetical protein n=1 Tax=Beduini massiliensis TaxID=1585974 RepID=UPI00059A83FF|nr:hypothetical protein [Beduini massiliensis]
MDFFYNICVGISLGIIVGFLIGSWRLVLKKTYSERQIAATGHMIKIIANIMKYLTFLFLILGLIWCIYFLVLGAIVPELAEYATNMSQLIVSVLTIISIIFAFFEFLRRAK